jgi:2-polyprenyl-6-methoxyphenol hydroxylase-like FAD-dependent oxidoreductase
MPDVLVAGGGPAGLSAAFELGRGGLDVLVVERRETRPTTQSKALGLRPRSVEVLGGACSPQSSRTRGGPARPLRPAGRARSGGRS